MQAGVELMATLLNPGTTGASQCPQLVVLVHWPDVYSLTSLSVNGLRL